VRGGRATRGHLGFRRKKGWTGGETSESSTLSATRTSVYVITNLNILLYTHVLLPKVVNTRSKATVRSRGVIAAPRRTPPRRLAATWVKCSICLFLWIRYRSPRSKDSDTPFTRSTGASEPVSPARPARPAAARRRLSRPAGTGVPPVPGACRLNDTRSGKARTYRRKVQFRDSLAEGKARPRDRQSPDLPPPWPAPPAAGPSRDPGSGAPARRDRAPARHWSGICALW
jgi:hypothetical protein